MAATITVTLGAAPRLFRHFWCTAVVRFDYRRHCKPCLLGPSLPAPGLGVTSYDVPSSAVCLYFCGVADWWQSGTWADNFHAPLVHAPGERVDLPMFGSGTFVADDARLLPIPELPDGWRGLSKAYTRCRCFRWAVATFGYDGT